MPVAFQVANTATKPPTVGDNGYQGFNPKKETLSKGWKFHDDARPLSEDMIAEHDVAVKVRDGCTLYCDVFRPVGSDGSEKLPAIVAWSPFGKKHNGIEMMSKGTLSGLERFEGPDPAEYCPRGFAIVNVDARGAGDPDGSIVIMGKQEGEDGHDVVEELAKMDWCNGSVGLARNSHLGIEAYGDLYREQFVRGGAWDNSLFDFIIEHVIRGKRGVEDFKEMYRRSNTMNSYWEDKRAEIEKINIPTYVVASYSSFVNAENKWLRWDPYQEWFDLWSVRESIDELAEFFDLFLKGKDNGWENTSKVRMASLPFGDQEAVYPIEVQDFPVPNTDYKKLYLSEKNNLLESAPTETSIVSYNSESGSNPVAHAAFNLRFDKKTRLMGLPKAVLYMSCDDLDDMVIYVLIRELDKNGKAMIAISIPWSHRPYPDTASIPESDYSNLMIYFGPTGILRASHRKTDPLKALHPQYPFHTHDEVQKITPGTVVELEIGLWAAGMDFEEGESLSVQVSGEYPLVDEFKGRGPPKAKVEERNKGQHNVHLGGEYASHVILPFV
ncbi:alpha/beta-hydrolase [Aureobasidium subglaciale]|nr:alpha/beta-hydrolase [Aureobasidium subglaciale]